jgi:hypothetical protein
MMTDLCGGRWQKESNPFWERKLLLLITHGAMSNHLLNISTAMRGSTSILFNQAMAQKK